ncbi:DNA-processing protein DprA [bacterium]|nr:DNA-processing protein DprA [bacterium]
MDLLQRKTIGFSGARRASAKGLDLAETYAGLFAREGWTVVSGYASGVDVASHRAALAAGGTTILVLPHGLDGFYVRPELRKHWDWRRTLVVSQFDAEAPFQAFRAIQRNAVIAGLSQGVLVFEPGALGGTLNTGMTALQLKIPLFAAVYDGMPPTAVGHRLLIARGGRPLMADRENVAQQITEMTEVMNPLSALAMTGG